MRIAEVDLDKATIEEVVRLLNNNQRIEAVKFVLDKTKSGLRRSKGAVDEIQRRLDHGEL